MKKTYSNGYSPCCDEQGHRPSSDKGVIFFCMSCGNAFNDKPLKAKTA